MKKHPQQLNEFKSKFFENKKRDSRLLNEKKSWVFGLCWPWSKVKK